ncbi:permease-like cell division protein FtsX, partial [Clostridium paraputrificum]|uniref:permease-like cell division protein FtsX n=3 Tax=Clostridiaceae TaxID=31979 RepID=UPI0034A4D6D9
MKSWTIKALSKDGLRSIKSNKLLAFAAILTSVISFTLLGIFYSIIDITNDNIIKLQEEVRVVAFLEDEVEESEALNIKEDIEDISGVESVIYVPSDEGLEAYKRDIVSEEDDDMMRIVEEAIDKGNNPIPDTLEIETENININEEVMNKVLELENVYKVSDGNLITDFLKTMSKYVRIFGIVLILILVISSTILISNVIKVSVFVRKREIGIMKYIGATDNYIRLPFIIEGAVIGALGAGISVLMVSIVHSLVNTNMSETLVS